MVSENGRFQVFIKDGRWVVYKFERGELVAAWTVLTP